MHLSEQSCPRRCSALTDTNKRLWFTSVRGKACCNSLFPGDLGQAQRRGKQGKKKKKKRNDHTTKMFISRNILSLLLSLLPASAEKPALTQSWNKVQNPLMDKI